MGTKSDTLQEIVNTSISFTINGLITEIKARLDFCMEHQRKIQLVRINGEICWIK